MSIALWAGRLRRSIALAILFLALGQMARLRAVWAQEAVARVASVQRVVEKQVGAAPFRKAAVGATLVVNDTLRTGKRSKADMKFGDGSLVRLGQITSIEIQSAKGVRLTGGRLLFAALKPGRVLAGRGTAEIIGSVAVIALDKDNSGEFSLYSGSMSVTGDRTVTLLPGQSVRVDPQGRLSQVRRATPFGYLGGELNPDLITEPELGPFTGSEVNERIREGADRAAVDQTLPLSSPIATSDNGVPRGQPFPTPFPAPGPAQGLRLRQSLRAESLRAIEGSPFSTASRSAASQAASSPRLSWSRSPSSRSPGSAPIMQLAQAPSASRIIILAGRGAQAQQALSGAASETSTGAASEPTAPASTSSAEGASGDAAAPSSEAASTSTSAAGAEDLLASFDLDTQSALDHIDEVDRNRGRFFDADARVVGAGGSESTSVYGARLRGFGAAGKAYFEGTLAPLQLRREGQRSDFSSVATGFLLLRDTRGEIRIGRQRFVAGPTQAAFFGSMIRQGGRETMDAIRIAPRLRGGVQLQAAYIYDAFPRNLPFQVGGAQKGFYGRAAVRRPGFSVGLNALKYTSGLGQGVNDTTGATVDFALPLVRDELEFYGEAGRDPFRRRLTTFGLGFPGLFRRTDLDAFLEYARLRESGSSGGGGGGRVGAPPSEVTLRLFRPIGREVSTIAALSHFGGGAGWSVSVGVSIGGSHNTRYGNQP